MYLELLNWILGKVSSPQSRWTQGEASKAVVTAPNVTEIRSIWTVLSGTYDSWGCPVLAQELDLDPNGSLPAQDVL